jgi:hypothetical protein
MKSRPRSSPARVRVHNLDTDSNPCVLHHNGGDSICRYGLEFKRHFFDLLAEPGQRFDYSKNGSLKRLQSYGRPAACPTLDRIPKLSIVTFTSFRFPGSAELSCHAVGLHMDVVHPRGPYSNQRRIGWLREYLDTVDTDYVLVMDSHDTFVTSDIRGILPVFQKQDCRLLFQAEAFDWPPGELRDFYDSVAPEGAVFPYLCAGIFMGEREFMKRVLDRALVTASIRANSDQGVYKRVFPEFHPEARLDYHCQVFQPLTDYKHPDDPQRFRPVDLNLELSFRPAPESGPDPKNLTLQKLGRGLPYLLARRLEKLRQRFG